MNRGDIVLLFVPFVGSRGGKTRPAVVVQCDALNRSIRETVIAEITSNISRAGKAHQVFIDISTHEGAATGLLTNSVIRCERLHTVPQSDVKATIGALSTAHHQMLNDALKAALAIR
ncbi:MAG TPA: type II toxin-antitoxin system PemK/MazF family toxin [Pirellulales bacterium]|nr:type II toxin-antitoxin system PemK/MazF family toxin [Pirellulales bacterium]